MISAPLRFLIAGITSLILFGIAVTIVFQARPQHEVATALLLTSFLCFTCLLLTRALEPLQSLPTMFCMMYFCFFCLLPGAAQVSSNTYDMRDVLYSDAVATKAGLIYIVFFFSFFIGQSLVGRHHYKAAVVAIENSERHSRVIPIALFSIVAIILGLYCINRFGFGVLLTTRGEFKETVVLTSGLSATQVGLLLGLPRAMSIAGVLLLIYAIGRWRHEKPAMNALVAVPLLVVLAPIFFIVNFPPALPRNWQFGILLSFMIVFIKGWRPWLRASLILGMVLALFSLFQWLNALRHWGEGGFGDELIDPIAYLKKMDFDGVQTTMNAVIYTVLHDFTYGKQIIISILFFVPRAIWTDKSEASSQMVAKALGYDFTNLSTPLPAEFYLDFSFAGVLVGGLLTGYLYRRMDYICAAGIDYGRPNLHLIIVAIAAAFTIFIMRGALYGCVNIFAPVAILVFLLLKAPTFIRFFFTGGATHSAGPPLKTP